MTEQKNVVEIMGYKERDIYAAAYGISSVARILSKDLTDSAVDGHETLTGNVKGGLLCGIEILANFIEWQIGSEDGFLFEDRVIRVEKRAQAN